MITFFTEWTQVEVQLTIELIKLGLLKSKITKIVKYQSFQYRLTHRAVMLNDRYHYNALFATMSRKIITASFGIAKSLDKF